MIFDVFSFLAAGSRGRGAVIIKILMLSVSFYVLTLVLSWRFLGLWAPLFSLLITASALIFNLWFGRMVKGKKDETGRAGSFVDLCRVLSGRSGKKNLPEEILVWIRKHLKPAEVSLYLQGPNQDYVRDSGRKEQEAETPSDRILSSGAFVGFLKYSKRPLFRPQAALSGVLSREEEQIRDRMLKLSAEVTVPLIAGDDLVGFINLRYGKEGPVPSEKMMDGMSDLFSQIAVALQNRLLCDQLRSSQARMRRADRLALIGTLTAGMAHEIRNPLVSIKTYFQLLPERYHDQEFRDRFQKVASQEVDRIGRLIEELLKFSRPSDPNFRPVNLHDLIEEVLILLESTTAASGVELRRSFDEDNASEIMCDPEQIKQVLLNIAYNALDAVKGKGVGVVWFRTRYDRDDGTGFVHLEIEDTGTGMTSMEIEKLFTPFYTNKSSGTGLGLAISRQIIEEHLGSITVESEKGRGTTFCLHLPKNPIRHERRKEHNINGRLERKLTFQLKS